MDSFSKSQNIEICPFCKTEIIGKTDDERVDELMKRMEVNDVCAINLLATNYLQGGNGLLQDRTKAMELWKTAAKFASSDAHYHLGDIYSQGGDLRKTKVHYEAAAMAGHEVARYNLACAEYKSGNIERALNHWIIAESAGGYHAMHALRISFEQGHVSRDSMDSTLIAYYNSCAEMRSEARDAMIHKVGLSMVLIFPLQVEI